MLANRETSWHLLLAFLQRNVEMTLQNKNNYFSYSYSLPVGIVKSKNKRWKYSFFHFAYSFNCCIGDALRVKAFYGDGGRRTSSLPHCLDLCLMQTLAEFNGIHDPKINLIQVCWNLNEFITMEDLLQGNKTINQLDHNAYIWRQAKKV